MVTAEANLLAVEEFPVHVTADVAVAALPVVSCVPDVFTPGKLILADPSNDTPPMVTADANLLAVVALPSKVLTTRVEGIEFNSPVLSASDDVNPITNLLFVASQPIKAFLSEVTLFINKPASFELGIVNPLFNPIKLSETSTLVVFITLVVPLYCN